MLYTELLNRSFQVLLLSKFLGLNIPRLRSGNSHDRDGFDEYLKLGWPFLCHNDQD